jgi:hypothetical protein
MPTKVDIFHDQNAAWPHRASYFFKGVAGIRQVCQHEPGVSEIKRVDFILNDICQSKLHVCKVLFLSFGACQSDFDIVNIGRNDYAGGTDDPAQIEGQIAASAANFKAFHSRLNACSI